MIQKRLATLAQPDGWIYVLAFGEPVGRMKVGMTSRHPKVRVMEFIGDLTRRHNGRLSYEMWVAPTGSKRVHETAVLRALDAYRLPGCRELFRFQPALARDALRDVCGVEPERVIL